MGQLHHGSRPVRLLFPNLLFDDLLDDPNLHGLLLHFHASNHLVARATKYQSSFAGGLLFSGSSRACQMYRQTKHASFALGGAIFKLDE